MNALRFLLAFPLLLAGCAVCDRAPSFGAPAQPRPSTSGAVWITNSSPANFADLDEVHACWPGGLRNPARFEGAFEDFAETALLAERKPSAVGGQELRTGLLTPEVEWVLVFGDPEALRACVAGTGDWNALSVEVRAMIEGKWFDELLRHANDAEGAKWCPASLGNNVATGAGFSTTFGEIERFLQHRGDCAVAPGLRALWAKVERAGADGRRDTMFCSAFEDFANGELNVDLQREHAGSAMQHLVRAVHDRLHERAGDPEAVARAINLSCFGDSPALVCDPARRAKARRGAMPWMLLKWNRDAVARRAMRGLVRRALKDDLAALERTGRRELGLNEGETFELSLFDGDLPVGTARLSLEPGIAR